MMPPIHHCAINDLHIDAEEREREVQGGGGGLDGWVGVGGELDWHNWTNNQANIHPQPFLDKQCLQLLIAI